MVNLITISVRDDERLRVILFLFFFSLSPVTPYINVAETDRISRPVSRDLPIWLNSKMESFSASFRLAN